MRKFLPNSAHICLHNFTSRSPIGSRYPYQSSVKPSIPKSRDRNMSERGSYLHHPSSHLVTSDHSVIWDRGSGNSTSEYALSTSLSAIEYIYILSFGLKLSGSSFLCPPFLPCDCSIQCSQQASPAVVLKSLQMPRPSPQMARRKPANA